MARSFSAGKKINGDLRVVQFRLKEDTVGQMAMLSKEMKLAPEDLVTTVIHNLYREYMRSVQKKLLEAVLPLAIEETSPLPDPFGSTPGAPTPLREAEAAAVS